LSAQHLALVTRQMRFKAVALIRTVPLLVGSLIGIVLAWRGYGVWSLVALQLSTTLVSVILTWRLPHWRPQLISWHPENKSLLTFGANLTASTLIYSLARGTDGLLIGRYYGSEVLGLYSRATALMTRPMEQFTGPLDAVFMPALSRLQREPERYSRIFLQV